jgi:hypothetical protein
MKFNYQKQPADSFVARVFVNLMAQYNDDRDGWATLQQETNNWQDIVLEITVNGETLNAERFLQYLDFSLNGRAEQKAKDLLSNALPDLDQLQETLDALNAGMQDKVRQYAKDNGISFDPYGD